MLYGIAMRLLSLADIQQNRGGAENEREGEVVRWEVQSVHLGVEGEDMVQWAEVGVSSKEGVVEEGVFVWLWDCVE